jgi:hypothetical protein
LPLFPSEKRIVRPLLLSQCRRGFSQVPPSLRLRPRARPTPWSRRWGQAVDQSIARPETPERLKALGAITVGGAPTGFTGFLQKDWGRRERVIKSAGVKAD